MLKLYHAPLTRSVRILWLLEELALPYEIETVPFTAPANGFSQATPFGKFPVLQDDDCTICESGAILEYLIERHGGGRMAPPPGSPLRGAYLQWVHFAEATVMPPFGDIARHTLFKPERERIQAVVDDAVLREQAALAVVERELGDNQYLLGDEFSGADIMMGYPLQSATWFGVLTDRYPRLHAYYARLAARPAFRRALEFTPDDLRSHVGTRE
jgi:glutathione S-transferase